MPKLRQPPIILTDDQIKRSWVSRAKNLRAIAAASRDPVARKVLVERAEEWERRAVSAEEISSPPEGASGPG